jgi:uncharacterized membrane protein
LAGEWTSTRSAKINPGVGGEKTKLDSKDVAFTTFFAALYALGVIFLAPVSFGIYQVRLADALLPLSMIFGIPSAVGMSLGCLVANTYGGLGIVDIVGGTVANFTACAVAWYFGRRGGLVQRFLASFGETMILTAIVGSYLSLIFDVPVELGLIGVFIGSVIAVNMLGFTIEESIRESGIRMGYLKKTDLDELAGRSGNLMCAWERVQFSNCGSVLARGNTRLRVAQCCL